MKKLSTAGVLFLFILLKCYSTDLPSGFHTVLLASGLQPTSLIKGTEERLFITTKDGKVLIVKNGDLLIEPFISIPVDLVGERGLHNLVFHPDFETNNYFYLYYTVPNVGKNRLSRFLANGDIADPNSEQILLETGPVGNTHNGGGLLFGPDGKLYLTIGDGANSNNAQNLNSLLGKALRINDDGSIPEDNPFYTQLEGEFRAIYALGLRNPFKAKINPITGKIYINDVGEVTYEELNELQPGANFGWPLIEGPRVDQIAPENYSDPLMFYNHTYGCSITGGAFYEPENLQFPEQYKGKYFFSDWCGNWIKYWDPITGEISDFASQDDAPLDMVVGDDGSLYVLNWQINHSAIYTSNGGTLYRIFYNGSGAPSFSFQPLNQSVPVEGTATFTAGVNGDAPLSYQWQRDGVDIEGATSLILTVNNSQSNDNGAKYRLVVTNSQGSITSDEAILIISTNTPPSAEIDFPEENATYYAGQEITFSGKGMDQEDGELDNSNLSWKIDFHHNTHTHPAMNSTSGISSGSFIVPTTGETSPNVWYRIYLTATDSEGISSVTYRDVFPIITDLTFTTIPEGLKITLDGQPLSTPVTISSVKGLIRTIGPLSNQAFEEKECVFAFWSESEERQVISFSTPESDTTITARYSILTGTKEKALNTNSKLEIFPNPAVGNTNILIHSKQEDSYEISIFDSFMKKRLNYSVLTQKGENSYNLNLSDLEPGMYFIVISNSEKRRELKQLVIER